MEGLPDPGEFSFFRQSAAERAEPAPGLEAGKVVGDFRLVKLIGAGGMGQVWEAEQLSLQRRVAVKFVHPERVTDRQLELFAREARAGGRLSHPGIVGVHGHGTSDGLAWIAMEFVTGAWTLRHFLDEVIHASEAPAGYDRHVARFVAEIAEAMQAAHDAGVIHRDLKPQNVLITPDDHPKITDFGLARITSESALSQTGDFAGTYYYMSPEQVTARRMGIDHRTDVFSLGIVLYELLALRRPFQGDTTHQLAEQIVTQDPPDPRSIRSRVPLDLAVIAGKALEKDRAKRYQTMREFAEDLRHFLADEPIQARPPTPVDRGVKWMRRNPAKSSVGGVVFLSLGVISSLLVENVRANHDLADSNVALARKTDEAERSAAAERERANEVLRLSDAQELEDLVAASRELWPALPESIARLEEWLQRARKLVQALPLHRAALAELSQHDLDGSQARWWSGQLERLITGIEQLEQGLLSPAAVVPEHGLSVPGRLALARKLSDGFAPGGEFARAWERDLPAIRAAYSGLELGPQMGLVPLGPDPASALWEFGDLQTGELATRGADGRLAVTEATGLVFVLLPGGTFSMGAQREDAQAPGYHPRAVDDEQPVHAVTLSPFFLSKYEMTQAQWLRATGGNPATYGPHFSASLRYTRWRRPFSLLHPIEKVSWIECEHVCTRLGLALPSEAQWEYAVRGATTTPWWMGDDPSLLAETGNVLDQYAKANGAERAPAHAPWDDGATVTAPIGSWEPNPFGLHEMLGNVYEWCLDGYGAYAAAPALDPVAPLGEDLSRVRRGGSYGVNPELVRSACRGRANQDAALEDCGLRPARRIER